MTDERIEAMAIAMEDGLGLDNANRLDLRRELRVGLAALDAYDQEHPTPFEDVMEAAKRWLEKVYPPDVPLVCDRDSPDPGPRLAAALRDCLEAQDVGAANSVAVTDEQSEPSEREDDLGQIEAMLGAYGEPVQGVERLMGERDQLRDLLRALAATFTLPLGISSGPDFLPDGTTDSLVAAGLLTFHERLGAARLPGYHVTDKTCDAIRAAINREEA